MARPGADREGHRSPARGAAAGNLDRARLRTARAARRPAAVADRRSRPRALRPHDGGRRDRDRPLPARRGRARGSAAADARAPGDPAPARGRQGRRRGDEGGRGRPRRRRSRRRRSSSPAPRRSPSAPGPGRGSTSCGARSRAPPTMPPPEQSGPGPPASSSTASSPCGESGRWRPAPSGRARSAPATSWPSSPPASRCGPEASRSTTVRSSGRRPASALPSLSRASTGTVLGRGVALVEPGAYQVGYRLEVALDELEPIGDGDRVRAHHGTTETTARVVRRNGRVAAPAVRTRGGGPRRPADPARGDDGRRGCRPRPVPGTQAGALARPGAAQARAGRHLRARARAGAQRRTGRSGSPTSARQRPSSATAGSFASATASRSSEPPSTAHGSSIVAECEREGTITLARARDLLGELAAHAAARARAPRRRRRHPPRRRRAQAQAAARGLSRTSNRQAGSPRRMQVTSSISARLAVVDARCLRRARGAARRAAWASGSRSPRRPSPSSDTRSWGGCAFGIVARTSSWIRVSTVSRNSRAEGARSRRRRDRGG